MSNLKFKLDGSECFKNERNIKRNIVVTIPLLNTVYGWCLMPWVKNVCKEWKKTNIWKMFCFFFYFKIFDGVALKQDTEKSSHLTEPPTTYPSGFPAACPVWSQWSWLRWELWDRYCLSLGWQWQNWAGWWCEALLRRNWWRSCPGRTWPPGRWRRWPWHRCVLPPDTPGGRAERWLWRKAETTSILRARPGRVRWLQFHLVRTRQRFWRGRKKMC